jgi:hypothetical protein
MTNKTKYCVHVQVIEQRGCQHETVRKETILVYLNIPDFFIPCFIFWTFFSILIFMILGQNDPDVTVTLTVTYSASAVDKEVQRRKVQPQHKQISCFSPGAPYRSLRGMNDPASVKEAKSKWMSMAVHWRSSTVDVRSGPRLKIPCAASQLTQSW